MLFNILTITLLLFCVVAVLGSENSPAAEAECLKSNAPECKGVEENDLVCGFDVKNKTYIPFENKCYLKHYIKCKNIEIVEASVTFCINQVQKTRRVFGESCPVFCPEHYRPVCGASKLQDYVYRAFKNGCFLDMLNCRGPNEFDGYVEVPLSLCGNHHMKNIWSEHVVIFNQPNFEII